MVELFGRCADNLKNDCNGALFAVIAGNGQRDTLAVFVYAQNDKLAGLCFFRNERRLDLHPRHRGVQRLFFNDLIHTSKPFPSGMRAVCAILPKFCLCRMPVLQFLPLKPANDTIITEKYQNYNGKRQEIPAVRRFPKKYRAAGIKCPFTGQMPGMRYRLSL